MRSSTVSNFAAVRASWRGVQSIEWLLALFIVALGGLSLSLVQVYLRLNAEMLVQREYAMQLAKQQLEGMRRSMEMGDARQAYVQIGTKPRQVRIGSTSGVIYTVKIDVHEDEALQTKTVTVLSAWTGAMGQSQQVELRTLLTPKGL